jgi:hypothetical protein
MFSQSKASSVSPTEEPKTVLAYQYSVKVSENIFSAIHDEFSELDEYYVPSYKLIINKETTYFSDEPRNTTTKTTLTAKMYNAEMKACESKGEVFDKNKYKNKYKYIETNPTTEVQLPMSFVSKCLSIANITANLKKEKSALLTDQDYKDIFKTAEPSQSLRR